MSSTNASVSECVLSRSHPVRSDSHRISGDVIASLATATHSCRTASAVRRPACAARRQGSRSRPTGAPSRSSLPRSRGLSSNSAGIGASCLRQRPDPRGRERACRDRGGCAFHRVRILPFPVAFRITGACIATTCDRVESDRDRIPLVCDDARPSRIALGSNEAVIRSIASPFAVTASALRATTCAPEHAASPLSATLTVHAAQELARLSPPSAFRPPATGRERPYRHQCDQCRRRARPMSGRASGRDV